MPDFDPLAAMHDRLADVYAAAIPPDRKRDGAEAPEARETDAAIVDVGAEYGAHEVTVTVTQLRPPDPDAFNLAPKVRKADGSRVPSQREWQPGDDA